MKKLTILLLIFGACLVTISSVDSKPTSDCEWVNGDKGKKVKICCQYTGNGVVCWRE